MTPGAWGRAGLRLLVAGGVAATGAATFAPLVPADAPPVAPAVVDAPPAATPYAADSLARAVMARNPFRVGRRAADVAYDPAAESRPAAAAFAPPKPTLRLVGLVEGARPQALVEGLPGVDAGRALGVGEAAGGLRVTEIARGRVRIVGMDTVWVLTLRRP